MIDRIDAIHERMGREKPWVRAASLRLLDEAVELCLASGCSAGAILAEVSDALASEAAKAGKRPSEMGAGLATRDEVIGELADVTIQLAWVCHCYGVSEDVVSATTDEKLAALERAEASGDLVVLDDGRFYRRRKA